jgi:hypothetical protein
MLEILKNLTLFAVWVFLSAALIYGIFLLTAEGALGGGAAVTLWLVGQLVILAPMVRILWVKRHEGRVSS